MRYVMTRTAKQTRGAFLWLAVLGVLIATTPSETVSGEPDILVIAPFLALVLAVPYLLQSRTNTVPLGLVLYLLIVAFAFAISNLAMPGNWALSVAVLGPFTMLFGFFAAHPQKLRAVIEAILVINLAALALQVLLYMSVGEIVDLHALLFPWSESRSGEFLGFLRLSGLHLEPGTYSAYLYVLVVFRVLLGGALTDRLSLLMLASFALTFSAWGIAAFLTGMIAIALSAFSNKRLMGKILLSGFIVVSCFLVILFTTNLLEPFMSYLQIRLDPTQGSASYRMIAYNELVATFDRYIPIGMPMAEKFCAHCQSPQDLGIWSQIIVRFGICAAVLVFVVSIVAAWKHSLMMVTLVLFAFTGKYDVSKPITWLFLALVLIPWYRQPRFRIAERKAE
ncbi:hypothetical protein [Rhodovulum sulfidophilum]|uniref:hypothetical protein n=1 Tax=Rhodovulum sulfidophilum TaxID=35806 RepID=UPI001389CD8C|nr:hypothetical protein [Rhodovulum sulfidophilum]NDK36733.1 hypothetical protein [Rhodovulum sulfidophilum]